MAALTVLVVAVLAHGLVSGRLRTTVVTGPMVFVAAGLLTGPEVFDLATVELGSEEVILLAEATLAIVLFSDAVRIDAEHVRSFVGIPARTLGIGLPLVVAAGTVVGRVLLDLSWARSALVASILAATDAALGQAVLTEERVPERVRSSLNAESGLNDGLALPAVTLFTAITIADADREGTGEWVRFAAEQIGFGAVAGAVVGAAAGWILVRSLRAGWVEGIAGQLAALALAGAAFLLAHAIGGNTFIAAFVAGVAFRAVGDDDAEHLSEYSEDSGQLLASVTFVVFGNALLGPALGEITWRIAIYVVLSLTVVRMVPIAVSLLGTGLRRPTVAFLGWFGPRGLASVLFALTVLEETEASAGDILFVVVAWAVVVSVVVHGATAATGARRYADWFEDHRRQHHETPMEAGVEGDMPAPRVRGEPRGRT